MEPANVVARLRRRIDEAREQGFKVRLEALDGEQATWCEIAGVPTLFVDISQTAAEQLQQLDEALAAYHHRSETSGCGTPDRAGTAGRSSLTADRVKASAHRAA